MTRFQQVGGDWAEIRGSLSNVLEVDFHYGSQRHLPYHEREPFEAKMDRVHAEALAALQTAHAQGKEWVILRHGHSTSGSGIRSARSVVRNLMRGKLAAPYIDRSRCREHSAVFFAAIKAEDRR